MCSEEDSRDPQLQVDVPVQLVIQVPRVKVVEEAVEIAQFQAVKKSPPSDTGRNRSFVNTRAWLVCRHAAQHTAA